MDFNGKVNRRGGAVINENGRAFPWRGLDVQNKQSLLLQSGLLKQPVASPLFFTSFWGKDEYPRENKQNAYYADGNSPKDVKFFKKVARQTNHKNSFTQIRNCFCDEFLLKWRDFHRNILYHNPRALSSGFSNIIPIRKGKLCPSIYS